MSDFSAETRMYMDEVRAHRRGIGFASPLSWCAAVGCRKRGGEPMVAKRGWMEELVAGAVRAELERAIGRAGSQPLHGEIDKALAELVKRVAAPVHAQADRLAKATAERVIGALRDGLGALKRK
jgi:hypothetical protein